MNRIFTLITLSAVLLAGAWACNDSKEAALTADQFCMALKSVKFHTTRIHEVENADSAIMVYPDFSKLDRIICMQDYFGINMSRLNDHFYKADFKAVCKDQHTNSIWDAYDDYLYFDYVEPKDTIDAALLLVRDADGNMKVVDSWNIYLPHPDYITVAKKIGCDLDDRLTDMQKKQRIDIVDSVFRETRTEVYRSLDKHKSLKIISKTLRNGVFTGNGTYTNNSIYPAEMPDVILTVRDSRGNLRDSGKIPIMSSGHDDFPGLFDNKDIIYPGETAPFDFYIDGIKGNVEGGTIKLSVSSHGVYKYVLSQYPFEGTEYKDWKAFRTPAVSQEEYDK